LERVFRLELQYDGTGLRGWAKQEGLPTVQGALEEALATVLGTTPVLQVAGRTDAGVHARRQVVSLTLSGGIDVHRLRSSLNALTPPGIVVTRIVRAPEGFDARNWAVSRTYRYFVCALPVVPPFWQRYCWHVPYEIDTRRMRECATVIVGRHDFTAFTPTETEHVFFERTVNRCAWKRAREGFAATVSGGPVRGGQGLFYLEIEANAFLRHMVRTLVGSMVEIGQGRRTVDEFVGLLEGSTRLTAGPTAPSYGLFFWNVGYR
jgi:tRNA pseudouridine38-40 synthase